MRRLSCDRSVRIENVLIGRSHGELGSLAADPVRSDKSAYISDMSTNTHARSHSDNDKPNWINHGVTNASVGPIYNR